MIRREEIEIMAPVGSYEALNAAIAAGANSVYFGVEQLNMRAASSVNFTLTPTSKDEELTAYLWPIVREMIKTAIENNQNLIVEGCYIPFDWQKDFEQDYLANIKYYCLVMSKKYIQTHFDDIKKYANVIENRLDDSGCIIDIIIEENKQMLESAIKHRVNYVLIDDEYKIEIE